MTDLVLPFSQASLVLLAVGAAIPLFTTALTKWSAPDYVKNAMTGALAIVATFIQQGLDTVMNHEPFSWQELGQGIVLAWAAAAFAYVKLWRNNPINAKIGDATANLGLNGRVIVQPTVEPAAPTPNPLPQPPMPS